MGTATRPDTWSAAPPAADHHDLIRVQGARENNLKDVTVELLKRRLTLFTGISGSSKSSLVFGTIAVELQRLINETSTALSCRALCRRWRSPRLMSSTVGQRRSSSTRIRRAEPSRVRPTLLHTRAVNQSSERNCACT